MMARANERIQFEPRQPLALVVSAGGDGTATVREALADAGFAERSALPAIGGWDAVEPVDVVVLDGENVDVAEALVGAMEAGRIDPGIPVLVSAPGPVEPERVLGWLRAGAWEVVATPADTEALSLFLTNLVRGRQLTWWTARGQANSRPGGMPPKEPYSWRALIRVTDETVSLTRRHQRHLSCIAFVPVWREPDSASAPMLLANRLARSLLVRARGEDLIGITEHGAVILVLSDTDAVGAAIIQDRLAAILRDEIRAWGMVGGLGSGLATLEPDDSAAGLLLRAVADAT